MRPDLQTEFISRVSDESYSRIRTKLNTDLGVEIGFRICEMPVFVSNDFRLQLEKSAVEIITQCVRPDYLSKTAATLSAENTVPNESEFPLFSVVDFAVCQDDDGNFHPKLIELQGFPSLLGYQYMYAQTMRDEYHLTDTTPFFSGLDIEKYKTVLESAIYANQDKNDVVLLEIDPLEQKTRPDFVALEQLIGLETINIRDVHAENSELIYRSNGHSKKIKRVFNRAIVDELEDLGVQLNFRWNQELDVEWAGHPNWYFRISKYSLPFLHHNTVPVTRFLNELDAVPNDLSKYVLKPLYSFAGKGVIVHPTVEDIGKIPVDERSQWILQERVEYASCVATPFGNNRVEIRVMLIWLPNTPAPLPVMSLARSGRGSMMGARYNTDPWTGSSGCLFTL